jgi:hypothetical protein
MKITNEKEYQKALGKLDNMIAEGFQGNRAKERAFERLAKAVEAYQKHAGYFDTDHAHSIIRFESRLNH